MHSCFCRNFGTKVFASYHSQTIWNRIEEWMIQSLKSFTNAILLLVTILYSTINTHCSLEDNTTYTQAVTHWADLKSWTSCACAKLWHTKHTMTNVFSCRGWFYLHHPDMFNETRMRCEMIKKKSCKNTTKIKFWTSFLASRIISNDVFNAYLQNYFKTIQTALLVQTHFHIF